MGFKTTRVDCEFGHRLVNNRDWISSHCLKLTPAERVVKIKWGWRRAKDVTRHPRVKVDSLNKHPEHRGLKLR